MVKYLKNDALWRALAIALLGSLLAVGSWGMVKVADMPEKYVTKVEVNKQKSELSQQICDLKTDLSKDIDRMTTGIHNRLSGMERRIDTRQEKTEKNIEKLSDLVVQHMVDTRDTGGD